MRVNVRCYSMLFCIFFRIATGMNLFLTIDHVQLRRVSIIKEYLEENNTSYTRYTAYTIHTVWYELY